MDALNTGMPSRLFAILESGFARDDDLEVAKPAMSQPAVAMLDNLGTELGLDHNPVTRRCWTHKGDPASVIKVEARNPAKGPPIYNRHEADAWAAVKGTEFAKWFAPVSWISPCGYVLVQARASTRPGGVKPADFKDGAPGLFWVLDDMHGYNFGTIGRQTVCLDYAEHDFAAALAHPDASKKAVAVFDDAGAKLRFFVPAPGYEASPGTLPFILKQKGRI